MARNFSKKKQAAQAGGVFNADLTESYSPSKETPLNNLDAWVEQIWFWRKHIDIFIEDYLSTKEAPIKLMPFQRIIAREIASCRLVDEIASRGIGKTWLNALCIIALSILYPENQILILSKNVAQAILTCQYIVKFMETNENIRREIMLPCHVINNKAKIKFKNGSEILAVALSHDGTSVRGLRAKYVFLDESILLGSKIIESAIMPILNYNRPIWWRLKDQGFEDFPSTLVETSSAFTKGVDFYQRIKETFCNIKNGTKDEFVCAISCWTGVRYGMMDEEKLLTDKERLGDEVFAMEYEAKFIGNTEGSFYPYSLVSKNRTLETVELMQPKHSTARYIASLDVATSKAENSDNAAMTVVKFTENQDGTFHKQVVYLASYKGYSLGELAQEVRKILVRFPSIEKMIIDANAIGEGVISLLQCSYVDSDTNKEYPPLVCEDVQMSNTLPILRAFRGTNESNNRGAIGLKLFLENNSLQLPLFSADLRGNYSERESRKMTVEELAVYTNADALLVELGYIKTIILGGGVKYDTESKLKHKDRYSSLMMCCLYLYDLENDNQKVKIKAKDNSCLAINITW